MVSKLKLRIIYAIGIILGSSIYALFVYTGVSTIFPNLELSDKGIILEIFGFLMYLRPIRYKLAEIVTTSNNILDKESNRHMIEVIAIIVIVLGLYLQLSNSKFLF